MLTRTAILWRWILLLIFLYASNSSIGQLAADFTADSPAGCGPLLIRFSDNSTGNPTSWKWDLGNGTISFLKNPSVTYFTPGQYTVKLVVMNDFATDSIEKSQYVTIYANPTVRITANPQTGCFPLPVQFTDVSSPGSGNISKWEWDFGDGTISGLQNPQHIYTAVGNYNVTLRITNSFGCVKTLAYPQYIKINTGVKANFTNNVPNTCNPPVAINFSNTSVGTGTLTYKWNFGDGTESTLPNPSHTYTARGSYTVSLIVTNSTGCSDTLIRPNAITLGSVKADFTVPARVCQGSIVNLVNTSAPAPAGARWVFGDGTTSDSITPQKIYSNSGTYTIKMIASFGACRDSISKTVNIVPRPVISFNAAQTMSCKAPFTANFTSSVPGALSYTWDFGDTTSSSTLANPAHTYLNEGSYTVKLAVSNTNGCIDTLVKTEYINIKRAEVTLPDFPKKGCVPLTVDFNPRVTSFDSVISYRWNFGDGAASDLQNPSHTYIDTGRYTITLITTTASGCIDTTRFPEGVIAGRKPVANFNANPRDVCAFIPVNFTDSSTGNVNAWLWYFGDRTQSGMKNPSHPYQDTGLFDVTLIVWHNGCPDTATFTKYVHILPPISSFVMSFDCANPMQRVFSDRSKGADKYEWDFGDGNTSDIPSPAHIYANPGLYIVKLKVTNFTTGCEHTKALQVQVINEKADFTSTANEICKGLTVTFQTQNINTSNISSHLWIFGDGARATTAVNRTSRRYTVAGTYDVTLIITDKLGCKDTLQKPLAITVNGPTAAFKSTIPGTCLNTAVSFTDSSFTDGIHPIQRWTWKYGDGKTDIYTAPPFQHTYTTPGVYTVSLKVIDSKGCADSITKVNYLVISRPVAQFTTTDTFKCPGTPVKFTNRSTGPKLTYLWEFGDGTTSTLTNPSHEYTGVGFYDVSLSVTDQYGCSAKVTRSKYINIAVPQANFLLSDSISTCPPLVVKFTNTSLNSVSRLWNFGDGTTSALDTPTHFYTEPGIYNIVLTATGPGGCTDFKTGKIVIKGPKGSFTYKNTIGCNPLTTNFIATTQNTNSFIWDFNDGTSVETPDSIINHTYTNTGIYLPKIILIDADGCHVPIRGLDTIKVFGLTTGFKSNSMLVCDSGAVRFQDSSVTNDVITSYLWNFGDGSNSSEKDPVHIYTRTGQYRIKLVVTTKNGCRDSVTTQNPVKIISSPKIDITGEGAACVPAIFTFKSKELVSDTSDLIWNWNFGNGATSTSQNPSSQTYDTAGNYVVQLIAANSSGCKDTAVKTVQAYPIPDVIANADTFLCQGKNVKLSVTGADKYNWSPFTGLSCADCANPTAKPANSIQYVVKGTSINGCISTDTVNVSVQLPVTVNAQRPQTLCEGTSVELAAEGADIYLWTPSAGLDNPTSARPLATPEVTTNYKVVGSDLRGCFKDSAFVLLTVYPVPQVNAGEDKTINVGQTIDLMPTISSDVTGVNWSPTSGVFRNNYPGIGVRPIESTEYTVEVINAGSCRARDKVTVYVICNNANIFIPNTFSPNGDGVNDLFYPRGSGVFSVKTLRIFNRWGQVVFEKANINPNNISAGWDGTFKGKKLPPDVFVYTLEVVCENKAILTLKGNIALIK